MKGKTENLIQKNDDNQNTFTKSILIVDDDRNIVEEIEFMLREELKEKFGDIPIHRAFNGNEAVEVFEREKPWLTILDFMMPGQSGFLVIKAIKNKYRLEGQGPPQIIIMTAIDGKRHEIYVRQLGVQAYLRKPFRIEKLVNEVKNSLREMSLNQETIF